MGSGGAWNPSGRFLAAYKEVGPDGPLQVHRDMRGGGHAAQLASLGFV
jgi:hypothetical protein